MPYRIVALCELIELEILENMETKKHTPKVMEPLNSVKVVGNLHLPVANPMLETHPGARWDIRVISEDFGLIDVFNIVIPRDLEEQQPLGDSHRVFMMKNRPPCLMDLGSEMLVTWPLRFKVDGCEIKVRSNNPMEIEVTKPKKKTHKLRIKGTSKRRQINVPRGIRIQ